MVLQAGKARLNLLHLTRTNEPDLPRMEPGSAEVECSHRAVQMRAELSQWGCAMTFELGKGQSNHD